MRITIRTWPALLLLGLLAGCGPRVAAPKTVTTYVSLDREFSKPVLDAYQARTGVAVLPVFDVESTKSVGLAMKIMAEAQGPRCDVYWDNEILQMIRLHRKGLLAPSKPANAADYPDLFKAKDGTWYGFAARARVLLVNTEKVKEADRPRGIRDLLDPKWKGRVGLAKPLAGTTATHAACLFAAWGDEKAKAFFKDLKSNDVKVFQGNKYVAQAVGRGEVAVGLTDTDDATGEVTAGSPVVIVYPDREEGQLGTLFLPNTVAVIKGAPHPGAAEALVNHLLSPEVEDALAVGEGVQIPLGRRATARPRVETPRTVHPMAADFEAAADRWDTAEGFLANLFGAD
ncbi:MAG TPA: extracellular solute-binding protein [Isosphaeraceae bacterium]|jgi:iron(III) transport system substrate-binding protein|nr:extracellular solute-binding protein [Isosphaeraceae bacterium]